MDITESRISPLSGYDVLITRKEPSAIRIEIGGNESRVDDKVFASAVGETLNAFILFKDQLPTDVELDPDKNLLHYFYEAQLALAKLKLANELENAESEKNTFFSVRRDRIARERFYVESTELDPSVLSLIDELIEFEWKEKKAAENG